MKRTGKIKGRVTQMMAKRRVDSHVQSFSFEAMTRDMHDKWILHLETLLAGFREARGR